MNFIKALLQQAICLPEYRDWSITREVIKARLGLLALLLLTSLVLAPITTFGFVLAFAGALGLGLAVFFDLLLGGGLEGGRRFASFLYGKEQVEMKRLERLAVMECNGDHFKPRFVKGLHQGLWLNVSEIERATGKPIARALLAQQGRVIQQKDGKWIAAIYATEITRASEPVGMQFVSVWLEKTAIPYWQQLEQQAIEVME